MQRAPELRHPPFAQTGMLGAFSNRRPMVQWGHRTPVRSRAPHRPRAETKCWVAIPSSPSRNAVSRPLPRPELQARGERQTLVFGTPQGPLLARSGASRGSGHLRPCGVPPGSTAGQSGLETASTQASCYPEAAFVVCEDRRYPEASLSGTLASTLGRREGISAGSRYRRCQLSKRSLMCCVDGFDWLSAMSCLR